MQWLASITAGSKTLNTDLITDIEMGSTGIIKVLTNIETASKLKFTLDGTLFFAVNDNANVTADGPAEFNFPVKKGHIVNFQVDTTGNVDILDVYFIR